jgi:hypothetical protein
VLVLGGRGWPVNPGKVCISYILVWRLYGSITSKVNHAAHIARIFLSDSYARSRLQNKLNIRASSMKHLRLTFLGSCDMVLFLLGGPTETTINGPQTRF